MHKKKTPSLGGIAIFAGFLLASVIWVDINQWVGERYLLTSLLIVFFLGVRDDLVPFRAWTKLIGQIAAVVVLLFSDIKINSLYGLFGLYEIPDFLSIILTALFIIFVTNAYNLIDGIDGLAGTIGILSFGALGTWFHFVDQHLFALLCFSMVGAMLAFLIFNWDPAEIFMGDTGAMVGGMLLSILTIHFMNTNEILPEGHDLKFASTVGAAACFIIVPLCDTIRIVILRVSRGQSPVAPDKSHIHHGLLRLGLPHAKSTIILGVISTIFVILSFLFRDLGDYFIIPGGILICAALSITLDRLLIRKVSTRSSNESDPLDKLG
jgi:UDP-N-acetylmuramyl pentapeptide phosphotransferase/UDP-N-acetylglucosamine-1-phosphate transferase